MLGLIRKFHDAKAMEKATFGNTSEIMRSARDRKLPTKLKKSPDSSELMDNEAKNSSRGVHGPEDAVSLSFEQRWNYYLVRVTGKRCIRMG